MKILLDHNVWPVLWIHIKPHGVESVVRMGWERTGDREIVRLAESNGFDVILTLDRNFAEEFRGADFRLRVLILRRIRQNREPLIRAVPDILKMSERMSPGQVEELRIGE